MCGIVGVVRNDKLDVDRDLVANMCAAIRHRGPDDDGFYFNSAVGLGMRRLAIIDLKSGQQPIHNQDRTAWIVFNGEIYNYLELRAELEKLGHTFYTNSDTEAIFTPTINTAPTVRSICAACLLLRSGTSARRNFFSRATGSARNRCFTRRLTDS